MAVESTAAASAINPVAKSLPHPAGTNCHSVGFGDLLVGVVQDANSKQLVADSAMEKFVTGGESNVQDVALSMAKADIAFQLVLEIRNRLIDSYQEVMRMQV